MSFLASAEPPVRARCSPTVGHGSEDDAILTAEQEYAETGAVAYVNRTAAQVAGFFEGLEQVDPGLVPVTRWRPTPTDGVTTITGGPVEPEEVSAFAGVAREP